MNVKVQNPNVKSRSNLKCQKQPRLKPICDFELSQQTAPPDIRMGLPERLMKIFALNTLDIT